MKAKTPGVDSKTATEIYVKRKDGKFLWLFNFATGGFNDVWALTLEDAISEAETQFSSVVDKKSFRQATEKSAAEQNRMGWMMTC